MLSKLSAGMGGHASNWSNNIGHIAENSDNSIEFAYDPDSI